MPTPDPEQQFKDRDLALCHTHAAHNPEGDCFVCDVELARQAEQDDADAAVAAELGVRKALLNELHYLLLTEKPVRAFARVREALDALR